MKPYQGKFRLDCWKRFFTETVFKSVEQAFQGSGQGLKPVTVTRRTWSMSYGLVVGSPTKSRE